jgi:cytochrome oxidase complex assembly protein 1
MPLYIFHVDVTAPPDVVAERLRAIVREKRGIWESIQATWNRNNPSGPAFIGSVQSSSFRLRRDIHYRNSFLPQIWGRIVSTPNGSRVNVLMFMHPFVVMFMLFWLASIGSIVWKQFSMHGIASDLASYVPDGMFIFGLALSIGGFIPEAVKAKQLLCAAILDPTITSVVSAAQQPIPPPQPEGPRFQKSFGRFLLIGPVLLLLLIAGASAYTNWLRKCPAFSAAMELAANSPEAKTALGVPIQAGRFVRGFVQLNSNPRYALLSIPVHGPRAKGTLYVVANRARNGWDLERVALWTDVQQKRFDLSPPPQSEVFHYPAPGRIYLLPLDEIAASNLKGLPAYYVARLGLDITLMPVLQLPKKHSG